MALLQKKCNGKLLPRNCVSQLLKDAVHEHEMKAKPDKKANDVCVNSKKRILEEDYAIRFPKRNSATCTNTSATSTSPCNSGSFHSPTDESDFKLAISLQNELNKD